MSETKESNKKFEFIKNNFNRFFDPKFERKESLHSILRESFHKEGESKLSGEDLINIQSHCTGLFGTIAHKLTEFSQNLYLKEWDAELENEAQNKLNAFFNNTQNSVPRNLAKLRDDMDIEFGKRHEFNRFDSISETVYQESINSLDAFGQGLHTLNEQLYENSLAQENTVLTEKEDFASSTTIADNVKAVA